MDKQQLLQLLEESRDELIYDWEYDEYKTWLETTSFFDLKDEQGYPTKEALEEWRPPPLPVLAKMLEVT